MSKKITGKRRKAGRPKGTVLYAGGIIRLAIKQDAREAIDDAMDSLGKSESETIRILLDAGIAALKVKR